MAAPQALKDELIRLLDEAYDSDGIASSRIELSGCSFLFYGEGEVDAPPVSYLYKIVVDATSSQVIQLFIKTRTMPPFWPE